MNRRQLLATASLTFAAKTALAEGPDKAKTEKLSETWQKLAPAHFAMAYYFEDAGPEDRRPSSGNDPFTKKGQLEDPPLGIIGLGDHFDVAGLVARVRNRVALSHADLQTIAVAVLDGTKETRLFDCYDPHHLIVTYNEIGSPTGAIEMCLQCQDIHVFPGGRALVNFCQDLRTVARLLSKAGLPLGKRYPSLQDYEADWEQRLNPAKK